MQTEFLGRFDSVTIPFDSLEKVDEWVDRGDWDAAEMLSEAVKQHIFAEAYVERSGKRYYVTCQTCMRHCQNGETFFPDHKASDRCESGKRNHCSCGICF